jgi:hypothetical protein
MPSVILADWEFWYLCIGIIISGCFMETMTTRPRAIHYVLGVVVWPLLCFMWIEAYCKQGEEQ